jgi:hypothetical protein
MKKKHCAKAESQKAEAEFPASKQWSLLTVFTVGTEIR